MAEEPPRKGMVKPPTRGLAAGRAKPARLKTAYGRTPSSQAWLERQINDPFSAQARALGYRSRAAFKLLEIDEKYGLLKPDSRVVDLGCAPGGWLQVATGRNVAHLIGIDLLPVEPCGSTILLQGDFCDPEMEARVLEALNGPADVVLSDMAPNTVGHRETDHLRIVALIEIATDFALKVLKPGGTFVAKAFQGGETADVIARLNRRFDKVRNVKPKASRSDSSELFLVATGFKG